MTVESANFISQLNDSLPDESDSRTEGDDHIRLIKTVLQGSFPNLGPASANVTAAELNILDGVTSTTAELNILDGVTATAAELNRMDGNVGSSNASSVQAKLGIYSGYVDAAATAAQRVPNGWSVLNVGTGTYTVTHNLTLGNASDLNISASPIGADEEILIISSTTTNSFQVKIYAWSSLTDDFNLENSQWHFVAIDRTA